MTITRCDVREYKEHRYTCRTGGFNVEASFMLPTTVASSCKLRFSGSAARAEITELRIKSSLEKNLRQKLTFWSHTWVMLFLLLCFAILMGHFPHVPKFKMLYSCRHQLSNSQWKDQKNKQRMTQGTNLPSEQADQSKRSCSCWPQALRPSAPLQYFFPINSV